MRLTELPTTNPPLDRDTRAKLQDLYEHLDQLEPRLRSEVIRYLRSAHPPHPAEKRLAADADLILDALARSGDLTIRMLRGVIAEAAFEREILEGLEGWAAGPVPENAAYDFLVTDPLGAVRVQVKLQRSERGKPLLRNGFFMVETQKTRAGKDKEGLSTRPYRYGEFDILAVSLMPSSGRWVDFVYTVCSWLQPSLASADHIATLQPVALDENEDWTRDFAECVRRLRHGAKKTITGYIKRDPLNDG
jgi:hypothetical protein